MISGNITALLCTCSISNKTYFQLLSNTNSLSQFFSTIEKAYDTAWKYGIITKLISIGIRGRLVQFIAYFLNNEPIQERVGNTLFPFYLMDNGVSRGSILSVLCFLLLTASSTKSHLPYSLDYSLMTLILLFRQTALSMPKTYCNSSYKTLKDGAANPDFDSRLPRQSMSSSQ